MILVDSSAWIEFFRGTDSSVDARLQGLLRSDQELITTQPVLLELLAGTQEPAHGVRIRRTLAGCRMEPVSSAHDWEGAADLYVTCRRSGTTPRRLFDCLIAAVAIRAGVPVLARDRDYELISQHTSLRLAA